MKKSKYIMIAKKSADALLELQEKDGSLKARYDSKWRPAVNWCCLTGIAQVAIIWFRLYGVFHEKKYLHAALKANDFLCNQQPQDAKNSGINGGMAGSFPFNADYEPNRYLNWATKFFIDSLLLEKRYIRR